MRAPRLTLAVLTAMLALAAPSAFAAPAVVFGASTLEVAPSSSYTTSAIVVQAPEGLAQVDVDIVIPAGLTLDTAPSGTGLACLTPGTGTSMFFASWNAGSRTISISTMIDSGGRVAESLRFATGASVSLQQITLVKPTDRGSWPAGSTFGSLTLQPPHVLTITSPTLGSTTVNPGASTSCAAAATDTLGHGFTYRWTASVAGGSFANATAATTSYTAPPNDSATPLTVTITCTATCDVNSAVYAAKSVNLTVNPHRLTFTAAPNASPATVVGRGQSSLTATATDSLGHGISYAWSDGGAGGTFAPSASTQNPTYTAPAHTSGPDRTVTLTCTATCASNSGVKISATKALVVTAQPPKTVTVTSSGGGPVSIAFTPAEVGGKTSPQTTSFTLSYREGATGVKLTAPALSSGDSPRWFSHWKLDGSNRTAGVRDVTFDIGTANHAAEAVYDKLVGDLDNDADVDRTDADLLLQALFGEIDLTPQMDVNQDGTSQPKVDVQDASWILSNPYPAAGGGQ